ncbi:ABC transporter permease [Mycobacterium sp. NBC_00419]|uniref:ABC transporter permease n=1 Tax=Mycobacterium sp. NBC_00419 TaxID=2975989 RepID=UPI002E1F7A9F
MSAIVLAGSTRVRRVTGRLGSANLAFAAAAVIGVLFILLAIFGPLVAPHDPTELDQLNLFAAPSPAHLLGTDDTGRDLLSRLICGARPSLAAPAVVMLLAGAVGTLLAVSAAWFGGWWDAIVARFLDLLFGFPGLILAIVAAAVFGSGLVAPVIALSIANVPYIARILRPAALRERNLPYIEALVVQGQSPWKICLRHVVPNLGPLIVTQIVVGFGYAMLDIAAVSFLGLGLQPPSPEWGLMVANGKPSIVDGHPAQSLYAALTIVLAVVAFNVIGERVSQQLLSKGAR